MNHEIVAISTAFNPNPEYRRKCELSVLTQTIPIQHIYIDAAVEGGAPLENVYHIVHNLDPRTIVIWVDGDDWLAHPRVVERIKREYDAGAWLTWGQFVYESGTPGWAAAWPHTISDDPFWSPRKCPWYFTHLKTFRAGLFQKIHPRHLAVRGWPNSIEWSPVVDQAAMFPMLEMAAERGQFIPDVLYVYTGANSTPAEIAAGEADARRIRAMTPYKRLERAPW